MDGGKSVKSRLYEADKSLGALAFAVSLALWDIHLPFRGGG